MFDRGASQRAVGFTEMNAESSRSHAVFTIYVKSQHVGDHEGLTKKVSKFHLIDLAGSERADRTGASGTRLKEGAMINQSLSALGNVINALTKGMGKESAHSSASSDSQSVENMSKDSPSRHKPSKSFANKHVPYRSSKLTRLLQDSLGGNSYTMLICNISPAKSSIAETLSSLRFAERAKQVQNKAKVNADPKALARLRLMEENNRLLDMVNGLRKQMVDAGVQPVQVVTTIPSGGSRGGGVSPGKLTGHRSAHHILHSSTTNPSASSAHPNRLQTLQHAGLGRRSASSHTLSNPSNVLSNPSNVPSNPSNVLNPNDGMVHSAAAGEYDSAINDVETQLKLLENKASTLQLGRARVKRMRETVRVHQESLVKEHELLETALLEVTALENKVVDGHAKTASLNGGAWGDGGNHDGHDGHDGHTPCTERCHFEFVASTLVVIKTEKENTHSTISTAAERSFK